MTAIELAPARDLVLEALTRRTAAAGPRVLGRVATTLLMTSRDLSVIEACDVAFERHRLPVDEELLRGMYEQAPPSRRWLVAASSPFDRLPVKAFEPMWRAAFWRAPSQGRFLLTMSLGAFLGRHPDAGPRFRRELRACTRHSSTELRMRGLQLVGLAGGDSTEVALIRRHLGSRAAMLRLAAIDGLALLAKAQTRRRGARRRQRVFDRATEEAIATLAAGDPDQHVRRAAKNLLRAVGAPRSP